ncbi:large conductance mechanosensitive channel protein MscL [Pontibacter indicus]|uniref:Large-conductance mechanosensitive channel n=1 Tax=Pontibacter indicus TaxID=1317125 RepID=A0A1R3WHB2_9BACT|nr:large conductance mechanosensitive channel protein MscL [Pontibacter indicus]SIT77222.1 large conductance mechanosensitive channel [Pontibacter indicus]
MGMMKEFKEFAMRGNVMDLAIGIIIGGAFSGLVNSVVNDVVMPVVGLAVGDMDFSNLYVPLSSAVPQGLALEEARKLGAVLAWGNFITVVLNFLILAFIIFMIVKGINKLKRKKVEAPSVPPAPTKEEVLLTEMRDALRTIAAK